MKRKKRKEYEIVFRKKFPFIGFKKNIHLISYNRKFVQYEFNPNRDYAFSQISNSRIDKLIAEGDKTGKVSYKLLDKEFRYKRPKGERELYVSAWVKKVKDKLENPGFPPEICADFGEEITMKSKLHLIKDENDVIKQLEREEREANYFEIDPRCNNDELINDPDIRKALATIKPIEEFDKYVAEQKLLRLKRAKD